MSGLEWDVWEGRIFRVSAERVTEVMLAECVGILRRLICGEFDMAIMHGVMPGLVITAHDEPRAIGRGGTR